MGIMEKLLKSEKVTEVAPEKGTALVTAGPVLDGRDRLRFFGQELAKARDAVAELDARQDRLVAIINDADAAREALQDAVEADGGIALSDYAAGNAPDSDIAKLIAREKITAEAAGAAKSALQAASNMLAAAKAEVSRLEAERDGAISAYLLLRADEKGRAYMQVARALFRLHDELRGISQALTTGAYGGDLIMGEVQVVVPRFNLPSVADPNEFLASIVHGADERVVLAEAQKWSEARTRVLQDSDANLDDLLGPHAD